MPIEISAYSAFSELRSLISTAANGTIFIVPTSHDAEWIAELSADWRAELSHEKRAEFSAANFKVWLWSDLYREFAISPMLRQIDPPDHRLILSFLTKKFKEDNEDILARLPGISHTGFIDVLSDVLHELLREEIPPDSPALSEKIEHEVLGRLYRDYISYLEINGLMDSTQVAAKTREAINDKDLTGMKFIFAGFLSFTGGQKRLIEKMGMNGAAIKIFKPESNVKGLHDASAQFVRHKLGYTSQGEGGRYFLFDSLDSNEAELIARELALWSGSHGAFEECRFPGWGKIAILVQAQKAPELEAALARYHIPANSLAGRSVSQTPIGYLPRRIYQTYRNGWNQEDTALLFAHPCLGENAFSAMNEFCRAVDIGGNPSKLMEYLLKFVSSNGLWLDAVSRILEDDESGFFDSSLREISSSISELERKLTFINELQPKIGAAGEMIFSGYDAIDFLYQWSNEAQTATNPALEDSISVFTQIPSLASFDVLIIMGVTANTFPGRISSSPLFGDEGRNMLNESDTGHLPTLHEQRIQKDALLKRLLYAGESFTIISRPINDEKGRPLSKSSSLAPVLASEAWIKIGHASGRMRVPKEDSAYFPEIEVLEHEPMNQRSIPIEKYEELHEVSLSKLGDLVECPFLYWARQIAKIEPPRRGIFDASKAGQLSHAIWETAWMIKDKSGDKLENTIHQIWACNSDIYSNETPKQSYNVVNESVQAIKLDCSKIIPLYPELFSNPRLKRRKVLLQSQMIESAVMQDNMEEKLKDIRTGVELERKVKFVRNGVTFKGRCDRIDVLGTGRVIIDYKSSNGEILQLGGYTIALNEEGENVCGAGFFIMKDKAFDGVFSPPFNQIYMGKNTRKKIEKLVSETEDALSFAAKTVLSGVYEPNYDSQICSRCEFVPICRRAEMRGGVSFETEDFSYEAEENE